jgi:lipopolysaccharide transport system permease protein
MSSIASDGSHLPGPGTATAPSVAALCDPRRPWALLWKERALAGQLAARFFALRHRGTYLGALWGLLLPLSLLAVYTFIFSTIFRVRWGTHAGETPVETALVILCGMVPFAIFSETTVRSTTIVVDHPNYVKKVVFPLEVLPVAVLGSALRAAALAFVVVVVGVVAVGNEPSWTWLLLPAVLPALVALTLGVSWLLAALGVFVRDMGNVVGIVVGQMLFFLTPILYQLDNVPEPYRSLAVLNPLTTVVEHARRTVLWGTAPDWAGLAWCTLLSLAVMQVGFVCFVRSKRAFADVL